MKMGKKNNLGRAIIKDRFNSRRTRHKDSYLHTTELDDGYDWNRLNLKSVTEQNTLDEFLSTAELAGTEFIAEKANVAIVTNASGLQTAAEEQTIRQTQDAHRQQLKIPRRPTWDSSTTPEELDRMEKNTFLEWRRSLAQLQEIDGILMTPYERNLDFWRQLWRVIERSDVVVQIVDARNPLLFRCEDLETYVHEVSAAKINMILLNKADYLTHEQRTYWASYFDSVSILVAFWSATEETERLKQQDVDETCEDEKVISEEDSDVECSDDDADSIDVDDDNNDDDGGWETVDEEDINADLSDDASADAGQCDDRKNTRHSKDTQSSAKKLTLEPEPLLASSQQKSYLQSSSSSQFGGETRCKNSPNLLTGPELLDLFQSMPVDSRVNDEFTTVGMVGYPNVGKSSTINALVQVKRVSVSATPGHTKHFQTIRLSSSLMLCDCPGLVMPSFVSTKADMIINGILSIDQMRDYVPPVSIVCKYIQRDILEATYGIMLPQPRENEDPDRCPTAYELLAAYATIRGFMTHKGIPDYQRAARCILKDYVCGKLLHCVAPPGIEAMVFEPEQVSSKTKKNPTHASDLASSSLVDNQTPGDAAFFTQVISRARSGGVGGVVGFTRMHGYCRQHVCSNGAAGSSAAYDDDDGDDASTSATAAGNGKPSKRHNNSKKREKLRRITSHLEA